MEWQSEDELHTVSRGAAVVSVGTEVVEDIFSGGEADVCQDENEENREGDKPPK